VVQFWAGRYQAARATLGRATTATEPGTEYGVHDALGHLALLHVYEGKLHRAGKYAHEALAVADRAGIRPAARSGAASAALAAIALLWNDLATVREQLSRVIVATGSRYDPPTATAITLLRARLASGRLDGRRALAATDAGGAGAARWRTYPDVADLIGLTALNAHLVLGDTVAARRCLESISDCPERALALGQLHVAEGEPRKARSVLAALSRRTARPGTLLGAELTLGRLAYADGDVPAATQALQRALEHGRPEQLRRPFAEAGTWVRQVLQQHPELAAQHGWLAAAPGAPPLEAGRAPVIEPLTDREVDVLRRLAQALSTEDIASALYLSVNTVKTHLKSIYRKLGTSGRSATARRARELKLLPTSEPGDG
jgi:LuxR family maltose regulon positive regulatory protein